MVRALKVESSSESRPASVRAETESRGAEHSAAERIREEREYADACELAGHAAQAEAHRRQAELLAKSVPA